MLYMGVVTFRSANETLIREEYFHVVPFNMVYNVALTCKSVNETLVRNHSNKSC